MDKTSSSFHHGQLKAAVASIVAGSSNAELKTVPCSAYIDRNLESPRTRLLVVLNYARLIFKYQARHRLNKKSKLESFGIQFLQYIVSSELFMKVTKVSGNPQDEQVDMVLQTDPRFKKYLCLLEPRKCIELNVGQEKMRNSFSKLLAGGGMSAVIVLLESNPQHSFICFKIPLQSNRLMASTAVGSNPNMNGPKPVQIFIIFNFASQSHDPQWLITSQEETVLLRSFALFRFWSMSGGPNRNSRNCNGWVTIHSIGAAANHYQTKQSSDSDEDKGGIIQQPAIDDCSDETEPQPGSVPSWGHYAEHASTALRYSSTITARVQAAPAQEYVPAVRPPIESLHWRRWTQPPNYGSRNYTYYSHAAHAMYKFPRAHFQSRVDDVD
ncbi:hypothetical protein J3R30DRAFT_3422244, partial [Lentinula aciculospora]